MKIQKNNLLLSLLLTVIYIWLSYFTPRDNFNQLLFFYILLFAGYIYFLVKYKHELEKSYFVIGIIFRFSILFSIPNLSDDFYRFIWDGKLISLGINPLQYLPSELIAKFNASSGLSVMNELYNGMNSRQHYTCYPPVNQLLFTIGALFTKQNFYISIPVLKGIILLSEIGIFFLIKKLLLHFKLPAKNIFIYWLNPLVIIELTGNMHFEGIMLFFLLLAFIYLLKDKFWYSVLFYSVSVSVKLIPLMFLPVLLSFLGFKRWIKYCIIVGILTIVFFLPFINNNNLLNFLQSLDLYFQKFEFNASIYYLVREIGFWIKGYNIIQSAGVALSIISFIIILIIGFSKKGNIKSNIFVLMLYMITVYYLLAMIVHPWYIITLVLLSVFTKHLYPMVWSLLVIVSYYTYLTPAYQENMYLVALEYLLLTAYIVYEFNILKRGKQVMGKALNAESILRY
ncbi:MAG: mannosyltransferase [Chlorobi bacterium]|nr:mannosyltransferase [Chlorobiota bacterium]